MNKLFPVLLVLMLFGCSTFDSTSRMVIEGAFIGQAIKSGEAAETIKTADLSDIELMKLTRALNRYHEFNNKWKGFRDSPESLIDGGALELEVDLNELHVHYLNLEKIVTDNWTEYRVDKQRILTNYEIHVDALIEATKDSLKLKRYLKAVDTALEYIETASLIAIGIAKK